MSDYIVGRWYNTKKVLPRPINTYMNVVMPFLLDKKPKKLLKANACGKNPFFGYKLFCLSFEGYEYLSELGNHFVEISEDSALEEVSAPCLQEEMDI